MSKNIIKLIYSEKLWKAIITSQQYLLQALLAKN